MIEDPARYGQTWASVYDETHTYLDPTAAVDALHALAGDGAALELGIGTGRVAVPLAARGTTVHGIEASEAMIAQLRAKAGGVAIPVTLGDFTTVVRAERYAVVYIVFSTICGPLTQDGQIATFLNAAAHLAPGGVFVVEAFVPDPARFDRNHRFEVKNVGEGRVDLICTRHDPAAQRVSSQLVTLTESGTRLLPVELRYTWPSELDLMARLAGLRLRERWADWRAARFTGASTSHVSLYER